MATRPDLGFNLSDVQDYVEKMKGKGRIQLPSRKWLFIAIVVAFLSAIVIGGAIYARKQVENKEKGGQS